MKTVKRKTVIDKRIAGNLRQWITRSHRTSTCVLDLVEKEHEVQPVKEHRNENETPKLGN